MNRQDGILMQNRENVYHFLSRLYLVEVDSSLLEVLQKTKIPLDCDIQELSEGYTLISEYLTDCNRDTLEEMAVDFAKIFLGAGVTDANEMAIPYESAYVNQGHLVMQESWSRAVSDYSDKGVQVDIELYNVAADHIGVELAFMAYLCSQAQDDVSCETSLQEQQVFFNAHINDWTPKFCKDVSRFAGTKFYRGVGKITCGFLKMEDMLLNEPVLWSDDLQGGAL